MKTERQNIGICQIECIGEMTMKTLKKPFVMALVFLMVFMPAMAYAGEKVEERSDVSGIYEKNRPAVVKIIAIQSPEKELAVNLDEIKETLKKPWGIPVLTVGAAIGVTFWVISLPFKLVGAIKPGDEEELEDNKTKEGKMIANGTGFFISPEGKILTNNHVVCKADIFWAKLADKKEYRLKLLGWDNDLDVALLQIVGDEQTKYPTVALGDSTRLQVGEKVFAIGNPWGFEGSFTQGIISGLERRGKSPYSSFLETDVSVAPGNSGGPLLNRNGEVVGINTRTTAYFGSMSMAVPINYVNDIMEKLEQGEVARSTIGISVTEVTAPVVKKYDLPGYEGLLITKVCKASPAQEAGLHRGDVIFELNGEKYDTPQSLLHNIGIVGPGSSVELKVLRKGREITMNVTVKEEINEG